MDKCIVLSVESGSYTNRAGDEVTYCKMYYFNTSDKHDSRVQKGYTILVKDVYPNFTIDDFSSLPGAYKLSFRPVRNRMGRLEPQLKDIEFISKFDIPRNNDFMLLLGVKKYDFQDQDGKPVRGVKFFGIDPLGYEESSELIGYPLIETNIKTTFDVFTQIPAYYDVVFEQVRGRNGNALYKPTMIQHKAAFTFPSVPNNAPVSTT
ncbi:hypothetical protein [Cyanothece sp. BG0011]|uniref:hypothetical protein n=1 Tax=Cyanothece sp. BG0011 TaxID=2082950 RepID=UPI000D1D72BD|nr:hypothetical protein [Cyanothece sp. BG0011]